MQTYFTHNFKLVCSNLVKIINFDEGKTELLHKSSPDYLSPPCKAQHHTVTEALILAQSCPLCLLPSLSRIALHCRVPKHCQRRSRIGLMAQTPCTFPVWENRQIILLWTGERSKGAVTLQQGDVSQAKGAVQSKYLQDSSDAWLYFSSSTGWEFLSASLHMAHTALFSSSLCVHKEEAH